MITRLLRSMDPNRLPVATVMVVLIAGAMAFQGTALGARAAATIRSGNIVDGTIQNRDIRSGTIATSKLSSAARSVLIDTPSSVKFKLKDVDGEGSGIDADLIDGISSESILRNDQSMPMVLLTRFPTQTITNSASFASNAIGFTSETYDTADMHSGSSHLVTVPRSGVYTASCNVGMNANANGVRSIAISDNLGALVAQATGPNLGATVAPMLHVSGDTTLTAGQTLECGVYQDSGGDLGTMGIMKFAVRWVGPSPS